MKYKKGDVIKLKKSAFKQNGEAYKCSAEGHLFVIVNIYNDKLTCCIMSSNDSKVNKKYKYNIPLDNPEDANLDKHLTHVKVDRQTIEINENDVYSKIGHLSSHDYIKVITNFRKVNKSDIQVLEDLTLFKLLLNN